MKWALEPVKMVWNWQKKKFHKVCEGNIAILSLFYWVSAGVLWRLTLLVKPLWTKVKCLWSFCEVFHKPKKCHFGCRSNILHLEVQNDISQTFTKGNNGLRVSYCRFFWLTLWSFTKLHKKKCDAI